MPIKCPPAPASANPALDVQTSTLKAGTVLTRFHSKARAANMYNPNIAKKIDVEEDGARFNPFPGAPATNIPTLYAADSFQAAALESVFHQVEHIPSPTYSRLDLAESCYSELKVENDLIVLELTNPQLRQLAVAGRRSSIEESELVHTPRERVIDAHIEAKLLPFCKQPLRDVLMIMRDSGMRNQKEVFTMRWEHVDWANNRYFVYDSKSPKGRRFVPISPRVRQALLARYSEQKEGWVFPSKRARCGHLTTMAKQFEKARRDAGLPKDLVLYCARHGFGTEMYRATKNLFAVMNVMGHTAVSTTMKYQHQNIDEVAAVASHRVQ